jgi:hypothetical protein
MAAGLGFKTFTSGEVLTAADTNGYLMQGINVFANASARTAAITSPQEGQYSFLKDTNALEYYDGAAWVGAPVGDITAVTAGKGLTGGGSSGDVTVSLATTAKGDLVAGSGASTAAVLTVGSNGETLVADSSTSTGLRWQGNYAAGKNKIINGDFGIWQRGTSISLSNGTFAFGADRFRYYTQFSAGTSSASQQTFTPGTAPVAGYEGTFFSRITCGSTTTYAEIGQKIEDVRTFAGQTATFSFWAKASGSISFQPYLIQSFGSGGSGDNAIAGTSVTLTTSWVRYTQTFSVPSVSGKTIGAGSNLVVLLPHSGGSLNSATIDTWGWQIEQGSVATAFNTATGTIQGELAACQRYYYRMIGTSNYQYYGMGAAASTTQGRCFVYPPVTMRTTPTALDYSSNIGVADGSAGITNVTSLVFDIASPSVSIIVWTTATSQTQFRTYSTLANNTANTYVGLSAEL